MKNLISIFLFIVFTVRLNAQTDTTIQLSVSGKSILQTQTQLFNANELSSNFVKQNGNSLGQTVKAGTRDAYGVVWKTNDTDRFTISSAGNISLNNVTDLTFAVVNVLAMTAADSAHYNGVNYAGFGTAGASIKATQSGTTLAFAGTPTGTIAGATYTPTIYDAGGTARTAGQITSTGDSIVAINPGYYQRTGDVITFSYSVEMYLQNVAGIPSDATCYIEAAPPISINWTSALSGGTVQLSFVRTDGSTSGERAPAGIWSFNTTADRVATQMVNTTLYANTQWLICVTYTGKSS